MRPTILYRDDGTWTQEEQDAALSAGLHIAQQRTKIVIRDLVIPRYSLLPFARETIEDIKFMGGLTINTFAQFQYVANLWNWYQDLQDFTPTSWLMKDLPKDCGPVILKGETNSRKHLFNTHMYAKDYDDSKRVWSNLLDDTLIGQQEIIARQFVPLKTYMYGINGLPITEEFRFFVCRKKIISSGYYWSSHTEDIKEMGLTVPSPDVVPMNFLEKIISLVGHNNSFYAMDVARTEDGEWIVVELNAGEQSGLSDNDPSVLYSNLMKVIDRY